MKVMVLVKASKDSEAGIMPSEQLLRDMGNYNQQLIDAGIMLSGEGLHPTSQGARVRFSGNKREVVPGPFANTSELIAGFWLWKVNSMEEAIEWVKRCPNPHPDDAEIEIRRVFEADDFGETFTPELREKEASMRAQGLGLAPPRFEEGRELQIAGLNESYTGETRMNIPTQWERFAPRIGKVPGQVGGTTYGICWNPKPNCGFEYLAGVEVEHFRDVPNDLTCAVIPARRYAVFTHQGHVSGIPQTIDTIWTKWVPDAGIKIAEAPMFERYTEEFNPRTGMGGIEIWIPVAP